MYVVVAILLIALVACVWITISLLRPPPPRTYQIQLTSDTGPRRVFLAEQVRAEGSRHQLDVVLTAKRYGALEALAEVDTPNEFKFALVAGGVTAREYPNVRMVTALAKEPLHVLVRPDLADKGFAALRGKRIFLGPSTTASHHVAREVLAFVGLRPAAETGTGGYIIDSTPPEEAARELNRIESLKEPERSQALARLPDAAVFLAPPPSPLAKRLVRGHGYQLLPLPFADAFLLDRLNPPNAEGVRIDRTLLTPGVIPAYTYGIEPPVPAKDCPTIDVPLLLVAQDDADPEAVSLLLQTIHDSPLTTAIRPQPLSEQVHPFPLHPGTERYLHRNDPLLTPDVTAKFEKIAGGIGAFGSGLLALYTFTRLRKLNRFEAYYREIGRIELIARGLELDPVAPTEPAALRPHLETRLSDLKCRVLADFAEGGLKGEGLVAGIIALINDTRESLARTLPEGSPSPGLTG
ncbi:TAXI family TRAP transporter solute-binding subunit [Urbifossiella limnaea]|uniref:C4-dicarboxylate ABC transporter substrate-binding protein n=1 Tax=Urbifossiella limnaea TaxID=2528023 RepID=A0A517XPK8_9BACT|nr:TAXI family TRAP transporter solute-binding subunit [Urbifossiella limnaea]QDU19426.1 hypothetical protein ETAA1_13500 [Urbifossiella limnaea]